MAENNRSQLSADEVNRIAKDELEKIIGNESYKHSSVTGWTDTIVDNVIKQLVNFDSNYKYVCTCTIIQKNGAGLSTATRCYWNNQLDCFYNVRWDNKHLHCLMQIYSLPL
ncbi:Dynein light chain Tctex-type [Blomia tropicalis]|nr:Dynein light chain Tctex-type [Blomia tropicalis]